MASEEGPPNVADLAPPESVGDEEEVLYSQRSKLYCFRGGEWKLSGSGDAQLLRNTKDKKVRFTLKENDTLMANHYVINRTPYCDLQPNAGKLDGKTWVWAAQDYAGETKSRIEQFALKLPSAEKASEFKNAFNDAKEQNALAIKIEGDEEQTEAHTATGAAADATQGSTDAKEAAKASPSSLGLSASPERVSDSASTSPFAGMALFGSEPASGTPATSGSSLFSSSTGTSTDLFKATSGGLFSSALSGSSAGGLFSGTVASSGGLFSGAEASSGSLFSGTAASSGGLFSGAAASSGGLFSGFSSSTGGGLFSNASDSAPAAAKTSQDDEELVPEDEVTTIPGWKPEITLEVNETVETGEENEEEIYSQRSQLYRFRDGDWKQRGLGDSKLLKHKVTGKVRFMLRQEKTMKIVGNHYICAPYCELKSLAGSDKSWTWSAFECSDDPPKVEIVALKFKTPELAEAFKVAFEAAKEKNAAIFEQNGSGEKKANGTEAAPSSAKDVPSTPAAEPSSAETPVAEPKIVPPPGDLFKSSASSGGASSSSSLFSGTDLFKSSSSGATGGLFSSTTVGSTGSPGGLFATAASSGGLFSSTSSGGLFNSSASPATSSLFGAPASSSGHSGGSSSGAGLFSASPATSSLFGAPTSGASSSSLFGASSPGATSTSLFGAEPPSTGGAATGGLFSGGLFSGVGSSSAGLFDSKPDTGAASGGIFGGLGGLSGGGLFSSPSNTSPAKQAEQQDEEYVPEEEVTSIEGWTPSITLNVQERVETGEEEEEELYSQRSKLYRFRDKEWKERGLGEAKLLKHKVTGKVRFLLRQEKTMKIVGNFLVVDTPPYCDLKPTGGSDKIWNWMALDYSDEVEGQVAETFSLKFGSPELAAKFKEAFDEAKTLNAAVKDGASSGDGTATATSKPAAAPTTKASGDSKSTTTTSAVPTSLFGNAGSTGTSQQVANPFAGASFAGSASMGTSGIFSSALGTSTSTFGGGLGESIWGATAKAAPAPPPGQASTNAGENEELVEEEEVTEIPGWVAPVSLQVQESVDLGEEEEEVTYSQRSRIYRFRDKEWKERGTGDAKLLKHKTTGKVRFLLRQEKTLKIVANFYVIDKAPYCDLRPNPGSDKCWQWTAMDYSEDAVAENFLLKFATVELAKEFKEAFNRAKLPVDLASRLAGAAEDTAEDAEEEEEDDEPQEDEEEPPANENQPPVNCLAQIAMKQQGTGWRCDNCRMICKEDEYECQTCETVRKGFEEKAAEKKAEKEKGIQSAIAAFGGGAGSTSTSTKSIFDTSGSSASATGSFVFGASATPSTPAPVFGASATPAPVFGAPAPAATAAPVFGAPTTPAATGSIFGAPAPPPAVAAPAAAGSIFGAPAPTAAAAAAPIFGTSAGTPREEPEKTAVTAAAPAAFTPPNPVASGPGAGGAPGFGLQEPPPPAPPPLPPPQGSAMNFGGTPPAPAMGASMGCNPMAMGGCGPNQMLMPMMQMMMSTMAEAKIQAQAAEASKQMSDDHAKRYMDEARNATERAQSAEASARRAQDDAVRANQREEEQAERLKRQERKFAEELAHEQELRRKMESQLLQRVAETEQHSNKVDQHVLQLESQLEKLKREVDAEREKRTALESQLGKSDHMVASLSKRLEALEHRLDDGAQRESVKLDRVEAMEEKLNRQSLASLQTLPFADRIYAKFQYETSPTAQVLSSDQGNSSARGPRPLLRLI